MDLNKSEIDTLLEVINYSRKIMGLTGVQEKNLDSISTKLLQISGNYKEFKRDY